MSWGVVWHNPATGERSWAVLVEGSHHWEPEKNGGRELASTWEEKGHAAAWRRSLKPHIQKNTSCERLT